MDRCRLDGSSKDHSAVVHGSVAALVTQPAGYETEIPCMADVNVSVRAGAADGDALALGWAGTDAGAGDAGAGGALDAVEQPATDAAARRSDPPSMNEGRGFIVVPSLGSAVRRVVLTGVNAARGGQGEADGAAPTASSGCSRTVARISLNQARSSAP